MKNLPAELMWLESTKKQVEIAKDAYKEAKIHLLKSLQATFANAIFGNTYKTIVQEVNEANNIVCLALETDKNKFERHIDIVIDDIDIYTVADENGNITIKIMER